MYCKCLPWNRLVISLATSSKYCFLVSRSYYWIILLKCQKSVFDEHSIMLQSGPSQDEDILVKIKHKVTTRKLVVSQPIYDKATGYFRLGILRTAFHTRWTEFNKYTGLCIYVMKDWKSVWTPLMTFIHKHNNGCFMDYENNQKFDASSMQVQPVTVAMKDTAEHLQAIQSSLSRVEQAVIEHTKVLRRIQSTQCKIEFQLAYMCKGYSPAVTRQVLHSCHQGQPGSRLPQSAGLRT